MFVKWSDETQTVVKGAQAVAGEGDGWLPFIEGESIVVNPKTQTATYAISDDGCFVYLKIEGDPDLTWEQKRIEAYGVLEDQLDKIWHDIDAGKLDKTGAFYAHVKSVKDAHPKP
jgi:hypothetical protein|tara:strand:- start:2385 stop:2729 length:345 start_codon:yes stop_codon:yes gene_type:complete